MSTYMKQAAEAGDQYLAAVAESQDNFLKSIAAVAAWAPTSPTAPAQALASEWPTMQEITEANFAFAQKLLKQQHDFTAKLFATTEIAPAGAAKSAHAKGKSAAAA